MVSSNIKSGVTIFGVSGSLVDSASSTLKLQSVLSTGFTNTMSSVTYYLTGSQSITLNGSPVLIQLYARSGPGTYRKYAYEWLLGAFYWECDYEMAGVPSSAGDGGMTASSSRTSCNFGVEDNTVQLSISSGILTITMNEFKSLYNNTFVTDIWYI